MNSHTPVASSRAHIADDMARSLSPRPLSSHDVFAPSRSFMFILRFRSCSRRRTPGRGAPRAAAATPAGPAPPARARRTAAATAGPRAARASGVWAAVTAGEETRALRRGAARRAAPPTCTRRAAGRPPARGCRRSAARSAAARPRTGTSAAARRAPRPLWSPGGGAAWACPGWTCARAHVRGLSARTRPRYRYRTAYGQKDQEMRGEAFARAIVARTCGRGPRDRPAATSGNTTRWSISTEPSPRRSGCYGCGMHADATLQ